MEENEIINLFDTYSNMMYRISLSYLKNIAEAEDVVQKVFIKVIEGKVKIINGKERALLTQITINQCKDVLRSSWFKRTEELNFDIEFEDSEDKELFNLVMSLPKKYRIAIYLHYYEGYSFSEISGFLNISSSAVSMRLHRGRNILKIKLEEN